MPPKAELTDEEKTAAQLKLSGRVLLSSLILLLTAMLLFVVHMVVCRITGIYHSTVYAKLGGMVGFFWFPTLIVGLLLRMTAKPAKTQA